MLAIQKSGLKTRSHRCMSFEHYIFTTTLYFGVGWEKGRHWVYATYIHIDVKPTGKVWLQHDGTDLRIADLLQQKGISKSDLVIGFQAPHVRKMMSGYAEN